MLRSIGKQSGESEEEKERLLWEEGFAEKEGFKLGMKEWGVMWGGAYTVLQLTLPAYYALQGLCNGRVSVRPSVRPSVPSIRQLPAPRTVYRSVAAGARAAAAGSVMLRAEVRGSTQTCRSPFSADFSATFLQSSPSWKSKNGDISRLCVQVFRVHRSFGILGFFSKNEIVASQERVWT